MSTIISNSVHSRIEDSKKEFGSIKDDSSINSSCAVCIEEFKDDSIVCRLNCYGKHVFHCDCIKKWIEKRAEYPGNSTDSWSFKCPTCRTIVKEESTYQSSV